MKAYSIARHILLAVPLLAAGPAAAQAEGYPSNVIRIVVPTGPGTPPAAVPVRSAPQYG